MKYAWIACLAACSPPAFEVATHGNALRPNNPRTPDMFHYEPGDVVEHLDSAGGEFRIHYTRAGRHAVALADADMSGVPDTVERNALGRVLGTAVAGDGLLWQSTLEVVIGPVPLDTYLAHVPLAEGRAAIFRLVTPAYLTGGVVERWIVRPRAEGFRLGDRSAPPLLGVSSYVHGNGAPIHQESQ